MDIYLPTMCATQDSQDEKGYQEGILEMGKLSLNPSLLCSQAHDLNPCKIPSHHFQLTLGFRPRTQGTIQDILARKSRTRGQVPPSHVSKVRQAYEV